MVVSCARHFLCGREKLSGHCCMVFMIHWNAIKLPLFADKWCVCCVYQCCGLTKGEDWVSVLQLY